MKKVETWLLPVYGERESDIRCHARVWDVYPSTKKYLLVCRRRFNRMLKEDPWLQRMAYVVVPNTVYWIDAERHDIHDLVEEFEDNPIRADPGFMNRDHLDTDRDLLYVTKDAFYFRVSLVDTTEWYEAVMSWKTLQGMFKV